MPATSSVYRKVMDLSRNNLKHIYAIFSYGQLEADWDSYGAVRPADAAIVKANAFIAQVLSPRGLEVFYTTPTPDGDILVELKNDGCNLEAIFSGNADDKIILSCGGDLYAEHVFNDTTIHSCLNWLFVK